MPAADLEAIIDDEIVKLMRDAAFIHQIAGEASVVQRKRRITQATSFSDRWRDRPLSERRGILNALLDRVIVRADTVMLTAKLHAIPIVTSEHLDVRKLHRQIHGPTRTLRVPARLKRTGMETKLLIQGDTGPVQRTLDRSLLRLAGQALRYRRILDSAAFDSTVTQIAAEAGVSATYFTRVVRLSFLAPEITKMLLHGRQPPELTANKLVSMGRPPLLWYEQKLNLETT